jgi:hypothetical protein
MLFSSINLLGAAAILSNLASAAPTAAPVYPTKTTSQNFQLIANVTANDLTPSIQNYVVASYHTGAGEAYAVLMPDLSSGRIFYVNGTASDVRFGNSNILSDEGLNQATPPFPAGLAIDPANAVSINAGAGQPGIVLTQFPDPITELAAGGGDGFYACESQLTYGNAVQLFSKGSGETPEGCADVTLLPQCSEGSGATHPYGQTVNCYADVAGIDWSVYSSD